jgi:hypothetical protein
MGLPSRQILTRPNEGSSFLRPKGNFCICFGFVTFVVYGGKRR